uniref:Uncharacterized protein n=1 Tax=viral metagenome TaxID=1070528 RepID=A0A6C0E305_9ZZZZ
MDTSYLSIFIFLIITIVYYVFPALGKLPITIDILQNNQLESYYKSNISRLGLYFLMVVMSQFVINSLFLINKCGGNSTTNVGVAALMTFVPWTLIFGVMLAVLMMYPGLKTAFSDVIGYFAVAGKANDILTSILVDTSIDDTINTSGDMSDLAKGTMKKSAEAILKLCGNKSVLINQMSPENFLSVWDVMKPLMKDSGNIPDIQQKQQELLGLVVLKDNIGEGLWYLYTAVFLTSIISFNLASRGCRKTVDQLKASHDEYLKQEEEAQKQKDLNNSTTMIAP